MTIHSYKYHAAVKRSVNMLVPWYLMASYAYYVCDYSLLEDTEYDELCSRLFRWRGFITHYHARYAYAANSLSAGSGYDIRNYPLRVIGAARQLMQEGSLI